MDSSSSDEDDLLLAAAACVVICCVKIERRNMRLWVRPSLIVREKYSGNYLGLLDDFFRFFSFNLYTIAFICWKSRVPFCCGKKTFNNYVNVN